MAFYNREGDIRRVRAVLSGEPNLVYFVYGPINSGKTALLMKVLDELPEDYRVFYINFRGIETRRYEDFVRAMFTVRYEGVWEKIKGRGEIFEAVLKFGEEVLKKINDKFIVPLEVVKAFLSREDEKGDCFYYLEKLMNHLNSKGYRPVFILDELQMLKEVKGNGPVLHDLFNFLVRMTKETHLCHSLCSTSDCLFIEDIYSNARLEGRAEYILVDDLSRDDAYNLYEGFGFEDKGLIWNWIGGKIGDMIRLYEKKKQGYREEEGLKNMLKDEIGRLRDLIEAVEEGEKGEVDINELKEILRLFKTQDIFNTKEIKRSVRKFLIQENIFFYNPVEGTVSPQGRLIHRAIMELIS